MRNGRACLGSLVAVVGLGLLAPPYALGHGLVTRADLPVPQWLFIWGAGLVLLVSFLALGVLWRTPLLRERDGRALLRLPLGAEAATGAVGVLAFGGWWPAGWPAARAPTRTCCPPSSTWSSGWAWWWSRPSSAMCSGHSTRGGPPRARAAGRSAAGRRRGVRRSPTRVALADDPRPPGSSPSDGSSWSPSPTAPSPPAPTAA